MFNTLTRTRNDGKIYTVSELTLEDARKEVAWCMVDNAGQTRHEAIAVSGQLELGIPLVAYGYTFCFGPDMLAAYGPDES